MGNETVLLHMHNEFYLSIKKSEVMKFPKKWIEPSLTKTHTACSLSCTNNSFEMLSMCIYMGVRVGRSQGTRERPMRQERRGFREEGEGSAEHIDMREGDHWRPEGDRAHG